MSAQTFPQVNGPFVDKDGNITSQWRQLLQDSWSMAASASDTIMSVANRQLVAAQNVPAVVTTLYTATAATRIDKATISNPTSVDHTVSVYIVQSGASANNANVLVPNVTVTAFTGYEAAELQNHVLNIGDSLQAIADVDASLSISVSGALL